MISFIIPARNQVGFTERCLASVDYTVNALGIVAQYILIDDNSDREDGIQDLFNTFLKAHPAARVLRLSKHQHYTGVFALGIQHASHQNILFVSNDMMITPAFVRTLLAVSALRNDYGIIRGTSAHTDSHPEHTVLPPLPLKGYDDIQSFSEMIATVNGLHHVEDNLLSGDAVLIKKAVVEKIGVMDTRFFGYFGDVDYGLRAHLAGFKLVCAKGAWLHHDGAGHIKAQSAEAVVLSEPFRKRMALVEAAYELFRQKWDLSLPESYYDLTSLNLFGMAERNFDRVQQTCYLDPEIINSVEYISAYRALHDFPVTR